jgi:crotonobetainyl-CoA:carnitine CoA-transferase CaiB-like acyl-CoA transferase
VVGPLVHMSLTPTEALRPAPPLASHTREVLLECGLDESDVGALVAAGVISTAD